MEPPPPPSQQQQQPQQLTQHQLDLLQQQQQQQERAQNYQLPPQVLNTALLQFQHQNPDLYEQQPQGLVHYQLSSSRRSSRRGSGRKAPPRLLSSARSDSLGIYRTYANNNGQGNSSRRSSSSIPFNTPRDYICWRRCNALYVLRIMKFVCWFLFSVCIVAACLWLGINEFSSQKQQNLDEDCHQAIKIGFPLWLIVFGGGVACCTLTSLCAVAVDRRRAHLQLLAYREQNLDANDVVDVIHDEDDKEQIEKMNLGWYYLAYGVAQASIFIVFVWAVLGVVMLSLASADTCRRHHSLLWYGCAGAIVLTMFGCIMTLEPFTMCKRICARREENKT